MKPKTLLATFLISFFVIGCLNGQTSNSCVTKAILSSYSSKTFTTEPVTDAQIEVILKCGIKAPSARNSQPWTFIVVKDDALIKEIVRNPTSGNVLIIVAGKEEQQAGMDVGFDCALAMENMYIAAQSLGLGAHIYASPVNNINTTMKEALSIPDGFNAIAVLRIGNIDENVDAVSSATPRKIFEEVVIYK